MHRPWIALLNQMNPANWASLKEWNAVARATGSGLATIGTVHYTLWNGPDLGWSSPIVVCTALAMGTAAIGLGVSAVRKVTHIEAEAAADPSPVPARIQAISLNWAGAMRGPIGLLRNTLSGIQQGAVAAPEL